MNTMIAPDVQTQIAQHRLAVRRNPRDANAHALLGMALLRAGELQPGTASVQRALTLNPQIQGLQAVLATALAQQARYDEAIKAYRNALRFQNAADLQHGLADCLIRLNRAPEAQVPARRAAAMEPDNVPILLTLGEILHALELSDEAIQVFERVVALEPGRLAARFDLGVLLASAGRHADAIACFEAVLAVQHDHAGALLQLGRCYRSLKRYDETVRWLGRLHELAPERIDVLVELGNAFRLNGDPYRGITLLQQALELTPGDTELMYMLLGSCFNVGDWELAMQVGRRIMEVNPSASANSVMLFVLSHCCMDADELTREHFAFGERWEPALRALRQPHPNDRDPQRRLRVGMVSGDFYNHALVNFIGPVFTSMKNSQGVALFGYYNNTIEDSSTEQLRNCTAG